MTNKKLIDLKSLAKFAKDFNNEIDEKFNAELELKADKSELFSGNYNDLENKPELPSKTSQLENDSNFAGIYVGTLAEYEVANNRGLIPEGTIVIITDDDEGIGEIAGDIAKLGYAKLGELILGKEV